MKNLVTTWGRDVLFQTAAPPDSERIVVIDPVDPRRTVLRGPGPTVANFRGYVHSATNLKLDEMPEPNVDVVGYEVHYNAERKLWYADIQMDPGQSYCPFVRLALARYQPDSVTGAELSRVVLCDFAQLLPDRTVNVAASADGKVLQIDVEGFAPYSDSTSKSFEVGRNDVVLWVEMKDPGNPDPDIGWLRLSEPAVSVDWQEFPPSPDQSPAAKPTLSAGRITIPEPVGSGKYRIVVQEVENYWRDDDTISNRLVYADTIEM
jgi:hypothetical protein